MATAMYAQTYEQLQHMTQLNPESEVTRPCSKLSQERIFPGTLEMIRRPGFTQAVETMRIYVAISTFCTMKERKYVIS
jgi:hypothetical protein